MAWTQDTVIHRLRARRPAGDDPAFRLALAGLLERADLRPPGLPPSALLIVRHLRDPLPARLGAGIVRPDDAWQRALREALEALYHRAARPRRGWLPPDADAVLFADRAEMLACLALDLHRGTAFGRWWWRVPLGRLPAGAPGQRLAAALCAEPAYTPAALDHLAAWSQAAPVLDVLHPQQARRVFEVLRTAFRLSDFRLDVPEHQPAPEASSDKRTAAPTVPAPWPARVTASVPGRLSRERAALLGLGLMLHHEAASAQHPAFGQALHRWWHAWPEDASPDNASPASSDPTVANPRGDGAVPPMPAAPPSIALPTPAESPREAARPPSRKPLEKHPAVLRQKKGFASLSDEERAAARADRPGTDASGLAAQEEATYAPPPAGMGSSSRSSASPQTPVPAQTEAQEDVAAPVEQRAEPAIEAARRDLFEDGIETQLAGVLYLINLMTFLGLPACFEAAWRLASTVGPWGLVEALGRALLGPPRPDALATDPLWHTLSEWDGRPPGTPPGTALRGAEDLALPAPWLDQVDAAPADGWCWATRRGRLRVWNAAGYLVADVRRTATPPSAQARALLAAYGFDAATPNRQRWATAPEAMLHETLADGLPLPLTRWLAGVVPYLRYRLALALGLNAASGDALAESLLIGPGRLYGSSSHVDLVLPAEAASVPIRRAGLDRDPGWMPAFGRVILFHFR